MSEVTNAEVLDSLAKDIFEISDKNGFWNIEDISDFAIVPIKLALI